MTEYWSGSITFTGLGSGTDFDSVIEATMDVESYRLNRMEVWGEQWSSKLEQVEEISSELALYKTQLESISSVEDFLVKTAGSGNSSVLSVSASSEAKQGSYEIEVGQKAQNDIWSTSAGWDSADTVITDTDATFSVTYGDTLLEIEVPGGTTLEGFVSLINNDAAMGDSIRANVLDDGDEVHLQLRGLDLGAGNTVTIEDLGTSSISGLAPDDFIQTQQAQNAQIKVDGFPAGEDEWIERDSNTITDVIEGLSLTILDTTEGGTVSVDVDTDIDAIIENIESFVERTNTIREAIRALDEDVELVDEDGEEIDTTGYYVRGNYGMDIIEQSLQDILASKGVGFTYYDAGTKSGDIYTSLSAIGISTDADDDSTEFGNLVIDYDALEEALTNDPEAVARIFAAENDGVSYDASLTYDSSITGITEAGEYEIEYTVQGGVIVNASVDGHAASVDGWTITCDSGYAAAGLAVTANNHGDGTYSGTVCLRQGKINQTLDKLDNFTSAENGTLKIIEDSYQSIIDNNEEAMEKEQARLDRKEAYLIERYAALESLLGEYEDINTSLESLIADLE